MLPDALFSPNINNRGGEKRKDSLVLHLDSSSIAKQM